MSNFDSTRLLWNREYDSIQAIPSSCRRSPSKAFLLFAQLLDLKPGQAVLDVGCGPARNAIYLAQQGCHVTAVDLSESALRDAATTVRAANLSDCVTLQHASVTPAISFPDSSFDLIVDSYVSCHFVDDNVRDRFYADSARVLRPGGWIYSSHFAYGDGYYEQFVSPGANTATDPHNMITKRLYTETELLGIFRKYFDIQYSMTLRFDDDVMTQSYSRQIIAVLAQTPS